MVVYICFIESERAVNQGLFIKKLFNVGHSEDHALVRTLLDPDDALKEKEVEGGSHIRLACNLEIEDAEKMSSFKLSTTIPSVTLPGFSFKCMNLEFEMQQT